ncbi:hypothetical protein [Chryseobacterium cheonjiense]|uniref:PsbP C-terminal domain-containing protein n=1 Tax=Chryseobacterium cheonjiense TaxID=2728845 RepID=A0A7Y0FIF9_9FLAO|nr:hypothetical protein [Chryseobacterium cheonjiense]NML57162.1 hypothetical protein [Chryseobacterium cheonjiense]
MKKLLITVALSVSAIFYSQKKDSLQFSLPEKYNLHLEEKQENDQMIMMEYIPKGQNWDNYDIIVTKIVSKNLAKIPLQTFFDNNKKLLQSKTKNLRIKELSRNKNGEREYILFTAEADSYVDSQTTESQIQYYTKGENDVFMCIAAIKEKNLPKELVEEWSKVFLQSQIIK